jgi:hypothetical protein
MGAVLDVHPTGAIIDAHPAGAIIDVLPRIASYGVYTLIIRICKATHWLPVDDSSLAAVYRTYGRWRLPGGDQQNPSMSFDHTAIWEYQSAPRLFAAKLISVTRYYAMAFESGCGRSVCSTYNNSEYTVRVYHGLCCGRNIGIYDSSGAPYRTFRGSVCSQMQTIECALLAEGFSLI